jgi:hypothetical protein
VTWAEESLAQPGLFTAESAENAERALDRSYGDTVRMVRASKFRIQEYSPNLVKSCASDFSALFAPSAVNNPGQAAAARRLMLAGDRLGDALQTAFKARKRATRKR